MSDSVNNDGLPRGWTWASPDELACPERHSLGIGPFGSDLKVSDYRDSGIPLVFVRNIRTGRFGGEQAKYVSSEKAKALRAHEVKPGDVLITKMGDPPGDACVYPAMAPAGVITADCIRWRVRPGVVLPAFLVYATRTSQVHDQILEKTQGVAQKKISLGRFQRVRYPLAPLPEQHRIVAEIETQFTRLDAAVATLERVQVKLKRARASVLKAAVEGRLVPTEADLARSQKRTYEPANVLLARVLVERKARWTKGKKYVEPVKPDTEGLAGLPEGWVWASVDQTCAQVTDGDHLPPPTTETGIPFLVIGDVRTGHLDFTACRRVAPSYYDALDWKRRPDSADLLYTVVGSLGIPVRVPTDAPFCVQRHIAVLKAPPAAMRGFLYTCLASPFVFRQATKKATGTAQKTLGLGPLREIAVPLPPLAEQTRIVAEVDRRLSVLDALDTTVAHNLVKCARLRQSILKRAFEGKLVPQEPADHPAKTLPVRVSQQVSDVV